MHSQPPSPSGPAEGRITVKASTGVQGNGALNFGKLVWVDGPRLYLQVDSELRMGDALMLRVDLSPAPGTALLEGEVMRALPAAAGEAQAYLVRLRSVSPADAGPWKRFLQAKQSGGTLSNLSDVHDSGQALQPSYGSRGGIGSTTQPPSPFSGRASTFSSAGTHSSTGPAGTGRSAMRDALKAAMNRPSEAPAPLSGLPPNAVGPASLPPLSAAAASTASSTPSTSGRSHSASADWARTNAPPPPTPPPAVVTPPTLPPRRPVPTGMPVAPPSHPAPIGEDPTWLATNIAGRFYVEVKWLSADTFSHDVHTQLLANVLTLVSDGRALPAVPPVHLVLRHGALAVQCGASPTRVQPLAVTYKLELDASHLAELRRSARPTSTMSDFHPKGPSR